MSTQRKDQSRSARLGLENLWAPQVIDDAADRIVAAGFWSATPPTSGRVLAFPSPQRAVDGARAQVGLSANPSVSTIVTPVI